MTTTLKNVPINDFNGGLVTNRPQTNLELNQSPDLDNILLLGTGFKKRLGDSVYNSTAMNNGANIQGMTYFKPTSGVEYLVAVCGDKVYDSNAFDGTMDDRTSTLTITAGQNNLWTFSFLNDKCIAVGGAPDAPFTLAGGANGALLAGSPVSGKFGFSVRDRMFICAPTANPSTVYWSVLANSADWSGTGSGNNAAETNDGDVLVGGMPLNNNAVLLFKNYSIHIMTVDSSPFPIKPLIRGTGACGKNAIVNANGLVYFITNEPRMKATDGYTIYTFPDTIDDIWDGINKSRLPYIQGIHDPIRNLIHWVVSDTTSATNNLDIIWDISRKCWLRNTTGWDCNSVCLASGSRIFGGHTNGKLYEKYKSGIYNDASETSPGAVNGYWETSWLSFDNIFLTKQIRYMDILCKTQTSGDVKYSYGFNYAEGTTSGTLSQQSSGGKWDVAVWGTDAWGGEVYKQKRIDLFGLGNTIKIKIYNDNASETMEINGLSLSLKGTGISDIER